jgi:hypothetical protein
MNFESSPIGPSNEGANDKEKKELEEAQEQIVAKVRKARKKAKVEDVIETQESQTDDMKEETETVETPIEPEIKKPVSLEDLAKMVKNIQGLTDEEAKELVEKRRELIRKHSDYIWEARANLADIDNDIWVLTVDKDENESNEDYAKKRNTKDISTLSDAVKRGILTLKEFNDYKAAKEAIDAAIKGGVEEKQLEEAKIILETSEDDFAKRIVQYLNEQHDERESYRTKIANDLSSRTGIIERQIAEVDEQIMDTPENASKNEGLMPKLKKAIRKYWLGEDGLLGEKDEEGHYKESVDGFYGKKLNDSRNIKREKQEKEREEIEKKEKERTRGREMFWEDLKITAEIIKEKHEEVKSNLKKVLTPEQYLELEGIMAETKTDVNQANFNKINAIRKAVVEHILIADKPELKNISQIAPWAQMDSSYGNDMSHLLKSETHERLNFYKNEPETDNSVVEKFNEVEKEISRLQGENTIIKVLLGRKETSEIRNAFEHRKHADKSGTFKERKEEYLKEKEAEKKLEEQRLKNLEKKKQEKAELEKTIHEELKDDFFDFEIPVFDGKKNIKERHPVAIRFETYVSEKKTIMLKVAEIIDKRPKSKDAIKPKEIEGFTLGRIFDLETLSGAPQWIKDVLNDDAKEKLVNALVIKENQK